MTFTARPIQREADAPALLVWATAREGPYGQPGWFSAVFPRPIIRSSAFAAMLHLPFPWFNRRIIASLIGDIRGWRTACSVCNHLHRSYTQVQDLL